MAFTPPADFTGFIVRLWFSGAVAMFRFCYSNVAEISDTSSGSRSTWTRARARCSRTRCKSFPATASRYLPRSGCEREPLSESQALLVIRPLALQLEKGLYVGASQERVRRALE